MVAVGDVVSAEKVAEMVEAGRQAFGDIDILIRQIIGCILQVNRVTDLQTMQLNTGRHIEHVFGHTGSVFRA